MLTGVWGDVNHPLVTDRARSRHLKTNNKNKSQWLAKGSAKLHPGEDIFLNGRKNIIFKSKGNQQGAEGPVGDPLRAAEVRPRVVPA